VVGGGRALHPIGTVVGGFTRIPSAGELRAARDALVRIKPDALETLEMVADFEDLGFGSEREFVAVRNEGNYAINSGRVVSNQGLNISEDDYYEHFREYQLPYANAKQTQRISGEPALGSPTAIGPRELRRGSHPLMVGALARVNLNYDQLLPEARKAAEEAGLKLPDYNPFHNNLAQAIEIVHGIEDCIRMIESLDPKEEEPSVRIRAGEGGAVTEAPRGLLHHFYSINRRGIVEKANIVTPTAHNFMSIERDLRGIAQSISDRPTKEIRRWCEMLVRAYDPCFSCSVH